MTTVDPCPMCGMPLDPALVACKHCGTLPTEEEDNSKAASAAPRRKFRWKIIPAAFIGLIGALEIIGVMILTPLMIHTRMELGQWRPADQRMALSLISMAISGSIALYAARAWMNRSWKVALAASIIAFLVMNLGSWITPNVR